MTGQQDHGEQGELFGAEQGATGRQGRVESAVRAAIAAAALDDRDGGAAELAAASGRAVDVAVMRNDPYAVAQAGRELSAQLTRLRLDPQSRIGADAGSVQTFLDSLGAE